jgi:hypothetical protein
VFVVLIRARVELLLLLRLRRSFARRPHVEHYVNQLGGMTYKLPPAKGGWRAVVLTHLFQSRAIAEEYCMRAVAAIQRTRVKEGGLHGVGASIHSDLELQLHFIVGALEILPLPALCIHPLFSGGREPCEVQGEDGCSRPRRSKSRRSGRLLRRAHRPLDCVRHSHLVLRGTPSRPAVWAQRAAAEVESR